MSSKAGKAVARHWKGHRNGFVNQQGPGQIAFQRVTIGYLPDNVLLDIFDFYQEMALARLERQLWYRLGQVCRRWRYLLFASPRRLRLGFKCGATTPVREILDVWPPMQIYIWDVVAKRLDGDNIIAALEHRDRVCEIHLSGLLSSVSKRLVTVMQEPFPVLTYLRLGCGDRTPPVFPDTFLGGSAPRLRTLILQNITFPALPKLLLSARDLVKLDLRSVPHTGYISPEAMVTCLSALTNLEELILKFQSPSSCPDRGSQRPPPLTRVVLPALTFFEFRGVSEYLEDLLARINTPVITFTTIRFFNQVIFDIPQLYKFLSRTETLGSVERAELSFNKDFASFSAYHRSSPQGRDPLDEGYSNVGVRCDAFDWKISFLVQMCSQLFPLLSRVERLDIGGDGIDPLDWQDVDHMQ